MCAASGGGVGYTLFVVSEGVVFEICIYFFSFFSFLGLWALAAASPGVIAGVRLSVLLFNLWNPYLPLMALCLEYAALGTLVCPFPHGAALVFSSVVFCLFSILSATKILLV